MSPSKSLEPLPLILTKSHRLHDFLNASSLNISTWFPSTNFKLWMQTYFPTQPQISKENRNDTLIRCARNTWLGKTGAVFLKRRLTLRYRFCYTWDMLIAQHIIFQWRCQRTQRNPLRNDRWKVNKHQPSSYPMVIWYYFRISILRVAVVSPAVSV